MVKVNIAIKTKDRTPHANYLYTTVQNLHRAGVLTSDFLGHLYIVCSDQRVPEYRWPGEYILPPTTGVDVPASPRTLHQNARRCIQMAAEGDATFAMVLEDDLDFVDNFLENTVAWILDHPGRAMYVLGANYTPQIERSVEIGRPYWDYPVGAFYGAQALVWRRAVAAQLAEWLGPDPMYNGVRDHGHDLLLQKWGREVAKVESFITIAPSIVQHIGEDSGINNRFFQFQTFPGHSWKYKRTQVPA